NVLYGQGKLGAAEAAYRKAIDLQPGLAEAHCNLGATLMQQARFHEAVASLKRGIALLPETPSRRGRTQQQLQLCQRFVILDAGLPAILSGTEKLAGAAEHNEFVLMCTIKKPYGTAARFSRDAFAAEPKLAENVPAGTRYGAACAAALAGCGQGKDADTL